MHSLKARAKRFVNLNGASDNFMGNLIFCHITLCALCLLGAHCGFTITTHQTYRPVGHRYS